ncbi:MAG TPA: fused MFS/spermidine synthase [Gemmatimonadaceae bacterium]|nr:fused MFS/spermidine synthase [Gemmatimonadaceae bacterium]
MTAASTVPPEPTTSDSASAGKRQLIVAVLTLTVFMNSALLFSVEPMFSKLALPLLGGTPAVWNTCLVFFQCALLVGYAYAHFSIRLLGPHRQSILHIGLLAISLIVLPLQLRSPSPPPAGSSGVIWLLQVLTLSLGIPFVLLASGAPLVQRWLAASGTSRSDNPYFLYAASNLGSLLALLSYPLLIEPLLPLSEQRAIWSVGYVGAGLLVAFTIWVLRLRHPAEPATVVIEGATRVTTRDRLAWIAYSAVPSSLLMGATSHISTDVAAITLLWVVPLALYLLTFVFVFAAKPLLRHSWMVLAEPQFLVVLSMMLFWGVRPRGFWSIPLHLLTLFVIAMVCHGELARRRPAPERLTEFFLWLAVGGLIGGIFNALVAPLIFNEIREYPLALIFAAFLRPGERGGNRINRALDFVLPAVLGVLLVFFAKGGSSPPAIFPTAVMFVMALVLFSFRNRSVRFGLGLVAIFIVAHFRDHSLSAGTRRIWTDRSFFGVLRVSDGVDKTVRTFRHGTTLHGAQRLTGNTLEPLTYYHRAGPVGEIFALTPISTLPNRRVGIVGLGVGTLACYGRPGERWTFFEIDPLVARIAMDPKMFSFLSGCAPSIRIVLGDARLTLTEVPPASVDLLLLDAFSSDAIPVHLLTREAMRVYMKALAPDGLLAVHISNRFMELEPVVAALARELGLAARVRHDVGITSKVQVKTGRAPSEWVLLARDERHFGTLGGNRAWESLRGRKNVAGWTDDFSNVVEVLKWR